jgi:hypothetical protein
MIHEILEHDFLDGALVGARSFEPFVFTKVRFKCSLLTFTTHSSHAHLVITLLILISVFFFTKRPWDVLTNRNDKLLI